MFWKYFIRALFEEKVDINQLLPFLQASENRNREFEERRKRLTQMTQNLEEIHNRLKRQLEAIADPEVQKEMQGIIEFLDGQPFEFWLIVMDETRVVNLIRCGNDDAADRELNSLRSEGYDVEVKLVKNPTDEQADALAYSLGLEK